jgi:hypothetical protein
MPFGLLLTLVVPILAAMAVANGGNFCDPRRSQHAVGVELRRGTAFALIDVMAAPPSLHEASPLASEPRLMDRVRTAIRARHYSRRTEKAYVSWIRQFIVFHGTRHPREMGESEVVAFLSALATRRQVAASTQNQALSALVFLYREVLRIDLDWLNGLVRAKRPERLPVVLTREEVRAW